MSKRKKPTSLDGELRGPVSYEKDGVTHYVTEFIIDQLESRAQRYFRNNWG